MKRQNKKQPAPSDIGHAGTFGKPYQSRIQEVRVMRTNAELIIRIPMDMAGKKTFVITPNGSGLDASLDDTIGAGPDSRF